MDKIVECVPNFSEGRNMDIINAITHEIETVKGVKLLDVDPGAATNRTVVTFIGSPEAAVDAAFLAIKKASELIDMRHQKGEHPRHGATDVCPFVPVSGVTMEDCAKLAKKLGEKVGKELGIPVYLYDQAALKEEWKSLANVRAGEYEALPNKLGTEKWKPDFGPNEWNEKTARTGVVTIGAREFLIAYNVNLNTRDKKLANDIAMDLKEVGRNKRGPDGKFVRDENGKVVKQPGRLKCVRAIGWYIEEYNIAQISINLTNYKITPLWKVYEVAKEEAEKRGLFVTGSEAVGLVPKEALLEVGRHALLKQDRCPGVPEEELLYMASKFLGLEDLTEFEPSKKVVEYQMPFDDPLMSMTVTGFVNEVSMPTPAPGGGSISALAGSLAAALTAMVANLTKPKMHLDKKPRDDYDALWEAAQKAQELQIALIKAVDEDTHAFNKVIDGMQMLSETPEQKEAKAQAIQDGYQYAARVPYRTMELCFDILELAEVVGRKGLSASISDIGVAAMMANVGVRGAALNVKINLGEIKDAEFVAKMGKDLQDYIEKSEAKTREILAMVDGKIEG